MMNKKLTDKQLSKIFEISRKINGLSTHYEAVYSNDEVYALIQVHELINYEVVEERINRLIKEFNEVLNEDI